jgi:hypothetical protein
MNGKEHHRLNRMTAEIFKEHAVGRVLNGEDAVTVVHP